MVAHDMDLATAVQHIIESTQSYFVFQFYVPTCGYWCAKLHYRYIVVGVFWDFSFIRTANTHIHIGYIENDEKLKSEGDIHLPN